MKLSEIMGGVDVSPPDQTVAKTDRFKPVQYSSQQREAPFRRPAEPVTMEFDLPAFEKRKTLQDVAFSTLPLADAAFPYLRAGEESRLRGEGFLTGLTGGTPQARRERRAMQDFYAGAQEELPDWVKVIRQTGVPGGPFFKGFEALSSSERPLLSAGALGAGIGGPSAYLQSQARDPSQRLAEAAQALPQATAFGAAFGLPGHVVPHFMPQQIPRPQEGWQAPPYPRPEGLDQTSIREALANINRGPSRGPITDADLAGFQASLEGAQAQYPGLSLPQAGRAQRQENFDASRSALSSALRGEPPGPSDDAGGNFPIRTSAAVERGLSGERPGIRQRVREFQGGPVSPIENQLRAAFPIGSARLETRPEQASPPQDQGRPPYLATEEDVASRFRTPEQIKAEKLGRLGISVDLPQSRPDVSQDQVPTSAFARLTAEGYTGQALRDKLREAGEAPPKFQQKQPQELLETTALAQAHEAEVDRILGLNTTAQEKKAALQAADRTYQAKIREIMEGPARERQRLRADEAAAASKLQPKAGRPNKFDWPDIAKNWANVEYNRLSERDKQSLQNAYRHSLLSTDIGRPQRSKTYKWVPKDKLQPLSDLEIAQRQHHQSYVTSFEKQAVNDSATTIQSAKDLDKFIASIYEDKATPRSFRHYYNELLRYLVKGGSLENPRRNTVVQAYYDLSNGQVGKPIPINRLLEQYKEVVKSVPEEDKAKKGAGNYERERAPYKFSEKEERNLRQHFYTYGRRTTESFDKPPDKAAPWVIDEVTDSVFLSPYMPDKDGMQRFAQEAPLGAGFRVLEGNRLEPLVPEVPKGRIPQQAQQPQPPGGGGKGPKDRARAFEMGRLVQEPWNVRENRGMTPEEVRAWRLEELANMGYTGPGAAKRLAEVEAMAASLSAGPETQTGGGGFKPPVKSLPTDLAGPPKEPDQIRGPKRKTVPPGRRIEGETKMAAYDFGSPYRRGASGLPLGGPKPNQRPRFTNPELRKGLWVEVEKIFSPTATSAKSAPGKPLEPSRAAEQIIRAIEGTGRRQVAQGSAAMEPFVKAVYDLPKTAQLDLVHYIQTGGEEGNLASLRKAHPPKQTKQFDDLAKSLAGLYKGYEAELNTLDRTEKQHFIQNYLPQLWKEKVEFRANAHTFLKERKMPTYKEAMAKGFTPVTENPIEMTMMYMSAMRKYLDIRHAHQEGLNAGYIKMLPYKAAPPANTRMLEYTGRGGKRYYANEDFARVFNNYVSKGVHNSPELGNLYNGMLRMTNASTSLQLGLSAFHLSTMLKESYLAALSDGVKSLSQGKPVTAAKKFARAHLPDFGYYRKGDQLLRAYLGQDFVDQKMEHMAQLASRANMRLGELDEVYRATAMGSYAKNIVRGIQAEGLTKGLKWAAKTEGKQFAKDFQSKPVISSLQLGGKLIETVAHPLFYHYIPRVKAGVFMDRMSSWLSDNPHADMASQVREAQRIADVVDDQFGELVQNNLFWDNSLKQLSNLLLTSTGWTLGTMRLFGQGAADIARGVGATVRSGKPQPLTDRAAYLIATVVGVSTLNALYQALKGAGAPESAQDLATPRTGGTTVQGDEERALIPGYEKDIMGWWHDTRGEAYNKLGPLPKTTYEEITNKDWRGDPIRNRNEDFLTQALQAAGHMLSLGVPIALKSAATSTSPETGLSGAERFMGVRPAGSWITNPERSMRLDEIMGQKAWRRKLIHERRDEMKSAKPEQKSMSLREIMSGR